MFSSVVIWNILNIIASISGTIIDIRVIFIPGTSRESKAAYDFLLCWVIHTSNEIIIDCSLFE